MILDIIVALVISYGAYVGYSRGLIKTVFDTLSILVAIVASLKLSPIVINFVEDVINTAPAISYILGIVITFILVMALVRFIGKKIEGFFQATNLNFINKFSGAALQGLFFAIIISFIVLLADKMSLMKEETKQSSHSYSLLQPLPEKSKEIFEKVKPIFKDFWDKSIEAMDGIKDKADESTK